MNHINIDLTVPGSKSITNRALLITALAEGTSVIRGACLNDDSVVFMDALKTMGFDVSFPAEASGDVSGADAQESAAVAGHGETPADTTVINGTDGETPADTIVINGTGGDIPVKECEVYVGSAGTAARFLTAMMALSDGCYKVTSSEQMKSRPMRELLEALELMGAGFDFYEKEYSFPFTVRGRAYKGIIPDGCRDEIGMKVPLNHDEAGMKVPLNHDEAGMIVPLNIDKSSQFLSALLLCGPMVKEGFGISLTGKRTARSYVDITVRMMSDFGCTVDGENYAAPANSAYTGREYMIEPDVSSACYFYACAVVNRGRALVRGVHMDSMQGDIRFIRLLADKGFKVFDMEDGIVLDASPEVITGFKEASSDNADAEDIHIPLSGFDEDMSDFSDQTMTLACMAPLFSSPTTITGIAHIRGQESDRINAIVTEMNRIGIKAEELEDGLRIYPIETSVYKRLTGDRPEKVIIDTYNDHRIAMSFAILGTVLSGIVIGDPGCCAKTFPDFFDKLELVMNHN